MKEDVLENIKKAYSAIIEKNEVYAFLYILYLCRYHYCCIAGNQYDRGTSG